MNNSIPQTFTSHNFTSDSDNFLNFPPAVIVAWNVITGLAVIVNITHLTILLTRQELRKPSYNNFRLLLIITAVLQLTTCILRLIFSNNYMQPILGSYHFLCVMTAIVVKVKSMVTVMLIFILSVDRALCVTACSRQDSIRSKRAWVHYRKIVIIVCVISTLTMLAVGVGFGKDFELSNLGLCWFKNRTFRRILSTYQGLVLLSMLISSAYTAILARRQIRRIHNCRLIKQMMEVVKSLEAIIVWTLIGWLLPLINRYFRDKNSLKPFDYVTMLTFAMNLLITPLLYGLTNSTYRIVLWSIFRPRKATKEEVATIEGIQANKSNSCRNTSKSVHFSQEVKTAGDEASESLP